MTKLLRETVSVTIVGARVTRRTEDVIAVGFPVHCEVGTPDPDADDPFGESSCHGEGPAEAMYVVEVDGKPTVACGYCSDRFPSILGTLDGKP